MNLVLWVHPILESLATLAAVMVLYQGLKRFAAVHLGLKTRFPWKRHVFWGKAALLTWALGALLGFIGLYLSWSTVFSTGLHYRIALVMLPLLLTSYTTGLRMDRIKRRRPLLPLVHGLNNAVLLALAGYQAATGLRLARAILL